jgi:soluble lytic murein transglycosylase
MGKLPAASAGSVVTAAANLPLPDPPPAQVCASLWSAPILRPFYRLDELSLDNLADRYLRDTLATFPNAPEVLYALSRYEAKRGNKAAALVHARRLVPEYPKYEFSALPREIWNLLYPETFWTLVQPQARASGLDPYLVMGLIRQESTFNPRATSSADARGLMQILPSTAGSGLRGGRRRAAVQRLYDPAYNIQLGCRYLRGLMHEFGGNPEQSLAAYHAGGSRVKDWLKVRDFPDPSMFMESIPIGATRTYVEAVLRDAGIYRGMMSGMAKFRKCS